MIVYRIARRYDDPLSGQGAFRFGGRWNSKGTYMLYTAESLALARSELARHMNLEDVPADFRIYEIELKSEEIAEVKKLPSYWQSDPPSPDTQKVGDRYFKEKGAFCLKVPSVCDENSFNYLLNPEAKDYRKLVRVVREYPFAP